MAAPNLLSLTTVTALTAVQNVGTSATAIVTNSAASNKVFKITALYISNIDTTNIYKITVDLFRSSTAYPITYQVEVPAASTLDIISKNLYLQEGDNLRLTADAANKLVATCSYEEIT
jgi:hypothetical protein